MHSIECKTTKIFPLTLPPNPATDNLVYLEFTISNLKIMKYVTYFRSLTATEPESVSWERMMEVLRGNFLSERTF